MIKKTLQKQSLLSKYINLFHSNQIDFKSLISCVKPTSRINLKTISNSNKCDYYHNTIDNLEQVMCANSDKTNSIQITKIAQKTSQSIANYDQKLLDETIDHGYASIPTSVKSSVSSLSSISITNHSNNNDLIQLSSNIKNEMSNFLLNIQNGIDVYVRPAIVLNIISKEECLQLYQNVEKVKFD